MNCENVSQTPFDDSCEWAHVSSWIISLFHLFESQMFKREEQNFMLQNEIDNMAFIMPSSSARSQVGEPTGSVSDRRLKRGRRDKRRVENYTSLNTAALKRMLPIGLSFFGGNEQELVQQAKEKLIQVSLFLFPDKIGGTFPVIYIIGIICLRHVSGNTHYWHHKVLVSWKVIKGTSSNTTIIL